MLIILRLPAKKSTTSQDALIYDAKSCINILAHRLFANENYK